MLLDENCLRIEFDEELNNFTSIFNKITGNEFIKNKPYSPIVTLYAIRNNERIEIVPKESVVSKKESELLISMGNFGGYKISVNLKIFIKGDSIDISAEIANDAEDIEIIEVMMPRLSGIYLGDTYDDDVIIYPHHAGEKTVNPVKHYGKDRKELWRASSNPVDDIYRREINYCGLASMSWMYYYDENNGLYIGSHDSRFPVTGIIAETSGESDSPWMGFAFRVYQNISCGEKHNTGVFKVVASDKDWHYGTKIYREYITDFLEFDNTPKFLDDQYALNQCYNFKRSGNIDNYFKDIPKLYETGKSWGVNHMLIASWNRSGFDSFYPEYYPDMELGSAMEFVRGLEYIRDNEGFSTLYINARIFDIKSDFHKNVGEKMAMRNYDNSMYYETYGTEKFTVNCPSDHYWRDYLLDTADFAHQAYKCDGIYLDQLASAEPFPCYAQGHTHRNIGDFNQGYLYVLRELLTRMKTRNDNAYIMTENCGDIYGSYTWGNLTWNGGDYDEFYNVFKYTFPEFVQVNMVNPRGWEKDENKMMSYFYKDMQRAILIGSVLWLGITTRLRPEDGVYHTYAKQALNFRKNIQEFIKDAKFMDNKYIVSVSPKCDATSWEMKNGNILILAGNHSLEKNSLVKINELEFSHIKKYDINWSGEELDLTSSSISLPLTGRLHAFILERN